MPEQQIGWEPFGRSRVNGKRHSQQERNMDTTTLIIILIILFFVFGGGWYGRGRWY
jgi:uncharacterized membrane protein YccF (DUF307 family)